jgi:hypothetical protein
VRIALNLKGLPYEYAAVHLTRAAVSSSRLHSAR